MTDTTPPERIPAKKLERDMLKGLRQKGGGVTSTEARFLIDLYYTMQDQRVRLNNQVEGLNRDAKKSANPAEPHEALDWTLEQFKTLEGEVAKILTAYTSVHPMAWFFEQTIGIGPILSAGLLAYIDIRKAPTVGHIWNFAGLNSEQRWIGREEAEKLYKKAPGTTPAEKLEALATTTGKKYASLLAMASRSASGKPIKPTEKSCVAALSRRPWNAELKKICWKIGDSFVKQSSRPNGYYGHVYRERKALEWKRNLDGSTAALATETLESKHFRKDTDAYAWLSGECDPVKTRAAIDAKKPLMVDECRADPGLGQAMLPPAQIDMRARRYAVKLFLSHLHEHWYRQEVGEEPPKPFAVAIQGHAHYIPPPQIAPDTGAEAA